LFVPEESELRQTTSEWNYGTRDPVLLNIRTPSTSSSSRVQKRAQEPSRSTETKTEQSNNLQPHDSTTGKLKTTNTNPTLKLKYPYN
jgi:hypothetical protein